MRALSVRQPWASMIASGEKTIETRTWSTDYRGPLLICASKHPESGTGSLVAYVQMPLGRAVCTAYLADCRPMEVDDECGAQCSWEKGRFAWMLENIRPFVNPFQVKGQLGLFEVEVPEGAL